MTFDRFPTIYLRSLGPLALCCALLAGCASPPGQRPGPPASAPSAPSGLPSPAPSPLPAPVPPPVSSAPSAGAQALRDGVAAFELGEYRRSEQRLAESLKQGLNSVEEQLRAYKTLAFLYCITQRTAQCERSFEMAFAIDKKFDLTRAERGHPIWGPVFVKVQGRQSA